MLSYSDYIFEIIVTSTTTTERRLIIYIRATRESYERQEIDDVELIPSSADLRDGLSKFGCCECLEIYLDTGILFPAVYQWSIHPNSAHPLSRSANHWDTFEGRAPHKTANRLN